MEEYTENSNYPEEELKDEEIFEGKQENFSLRPCKCSRILIVDDEAFNLIVLEGLLLQYGGIESVDTAYNGKEALEMIEKNI